MRRLFAWAKARFAGLSSRQVPAVAAALLLFLPFPVGGMATGVSAVNELARPSRYASLFPPRRWPVLLWAAITVAMTVLNRNWYGLGTFVCFLLVLVFAAQVRACRSDALAQAAVAALAVGSVPACAVAALEVLFRSQTLAPGGRAASTVLNSNFYGYMCELIAVACAWALLSGLAPRRLFWLGFWVNLAGLWVSGCRSAWPALGAALLLLLLLKGRRRSFLVLLGVCAAVAAAVLLFPILIPHDANIGHSQYLRAIIWAEAWHIFTQRPLFGGGFLTYQIFSTHAGEAFRVHAHNLYLDSLDNFGAVGVGLLALTCVPAALRRARTLGADRQASLFFAVLLATAIHGITDVPIIGTQTGPLVMLLLAL